MRVREGMGGGGRGGRSRTQRKHFRERRENVWKRSKSDNPEEGQPPASSDGTNVNNDKNNYKLDWEPFSTQNPAFNDYYKEQGIVLAEEWDTFMGFLRKPLPAAFRVNSSSQFCAGIQSQLENDFMKSLEAEVTDEGELEGIRPLPWYPEHLAWQSNYSRMQLRKNKTLVRFHEFLKQENEIGNITRQEAVSMVPPLFLDVSPHHFVLDMCAAPGSKTFQLLEIIHRSSKNGTLPAGMVVANDVDVQRCNLLIHQTKRMCTANLIVTNHEAQHFPGCRLSKSCSNDSEMGILKESSINQLLFDRVLCDVPCSGDGTLRKAPDIWRKWNVGMGNGIHSLQVKIALRGISLLKVGGRMVYSTCSMNPVENEAVVAEILRRCEGSVELVDVSSELPQLVRRPGLKKWKVRDKGSWLASYINAHKFRRGGGVVPSMFPSGRICEDPTDNDVGNLDVEEREENGDNNNSRDESQTTEDPVTPADALNEEVSDFPLERCMRIVPHDQNSGAFFIAVFHKISSSPAFQEKPFTLRGLQPCKNSSDEVFEDSNGLGVNPAADTDEKSTEAASDVGLCDNEPPEAALEERKIEPEEGQDPSNSETCPEKAGGKRKLQNQGRWKGVDPVVFFKDEDIINKIKAFYGIDEAFPLNGHLVTRNSDTNHVKRIYYISKSVKDILELNFLVGQPLKITSIGLKMFERQTSKEGTSTPCSFRISSEGLPVLLPYITKQMLCASLVDFKHLLQYKSVKFADLVDAEFGEKVSQLMLGCCVLVLRKDGQALSDPIQVDASTVAIGCWKGRGSLTVMVTAIECQELLERLLNCEETENGILVEENKPSNVLEAEEVKNTSDIEMIEDAEAIKQVDES